MKKIKLLLYSLVLSLIVLSSCKNNDDIVEQMANVTQSEALQTALDNLDTNLNDDGTLNDIANPVGNIIFDFCFDFVYPIELVYNNGTTVTANSFEDLILILINSTEELFIVGIEFPFQVEIYNEETDQIEIVDINNEEEFIELLVNCNFDDDDNCDCNDEYDPVCVLVGNPNQDDFIIEFDNACEAFCEGFDEDNFVNCDDLPWEDDIFDDLCFDFNYPISIAHEGIITEVNSDEEFEILIFGINSDWSIVFPITVTLEDGTEMTIENEEAFEELLEDCDDYDDDCDCPEIYDPVCVQDVNEIIEFDNICFAICEGFDQGDLVDCVDDCICPDVDDPVCVVDGDQIIQFGNFCEAECEGFDEGDLVDCEDDGCECPDVYDPVCVVVGDEIIEFGNFCEAECEGFDQGDLVDCEDDDGCEVGYIEVTVGECNDDGTYGITINFEYEGTDQQNFDLFVRNNELIGYYALADLPLTIENFELSGFDEDYIKVCINDNPSCCNETEWFPPSCNNEGCEDECPQIEDPVCVEVTSPSGDTTIITFLNACHAECAGYTEEDFVDCEPNPDCYEFVFPITMYFDGESIIVDSNEEVDEYLEQGWELLYPIDIIVNNEVITVQQGIIEGAYGERCD